MSRTNPSQHRKEREGMKNKYDHIDWDLTFEMSKTMSAIELAKKEIKTWNKFLKLAEKRLSKLSKRL